VAKPVITTEELQRLQQTSSRVFVHHAIVDYVVRIVLATRHPAQNGMPDVAQWISYGASPRASLGLIAAGRAMALLRGRDYVLPQDVLDIATDVLPHRMVMSYDAIADGVPALHAVRRVLQTIPLPQVAPRQRTGAPAPMPPGYQPGQPGPLPSQPGQPYAGYQPPAYQPPAYQPPPNQPGPPQGQPGQPQAQPAQPGPPAQGPQQPGAWERSA
jgi:MoxR-like ATPase